MSKFRHEEKILITQSDFYVLKNRLSRIFSLDPHVGEGGFYSIKSLYFDDYLDSALVDKINGLDKREKYRIRTYDLGESFFLERKSKIRGLCQKLKVPLEKEEVEEIIRGKPEFLKAKTGLERKLYSQIKGNNLRPKVVVSYKRIPYVYGPGNVRITLDYEIRTDYKIQDFTETKVNNVPTGEDILMEIKWDEFLPDIVKSATKVGQKRPQAFSKYAVCRGFK